MNIYKKYRACLKVCGYRRVHPKHPYYLKLVGFSILVAHIQRGKLEISQRFCNRLREVSIWDSKVITFKDVPNPNIQEIAALEYAVMKDGNFLYSDICNLVHELTFQELIEV